MTCQDVAAFLSDYLDGSLPVWQRIAFGFHLRFCRDCRHYLDSYQKTRSLLEAMAIECRAETDESIPESLVQAILAARTFPGRETKLDA